MGRRRWAWSHPLAALAVWDYCAASARWVFGERLGDPVAERILAAVRAAPEGLRRKELRDLFDRHVSSGEVDRALSALAASGLMRSEQIDTGGRPATICWAVDASVGDSALSAHNAQGASDGDSALSALSAQASFTARARAFLASSDLQRSALSEISAEGSAATDSSDCALSAKSAESPTDPPDARASLLALAEARGWPTVSLRPGR